MNCITGESISDLAHLRQRMADILTTPIGSRVMRRTYGSFLPEIIDQPLNAVTLLQAYAAIVIALQTWEPYILIDAVNTLVSTAEVGRASVTISVIRLDTGTPQYQSIVVPL